PEHHGFIAEGRSDPRPEILERLARLIGKGGLIVSYNASFEKQRIMESCERFLRFRTLWESVSGRFVDLLEPFRSFAWYHPAQKGSASMKAVLPALTGETYSGLEIAEGGTASREYLRVTYGDVPPPEREQVRKRLEEYCALDTAGMISIVEALTKAAR
ncbi:MAG TPA: DUF2779 domain-containing protein, partial [Candidatus Acidoferrum sp.]|nr:DUF2779 domain-containing protein [Candidatus Acidoferrum sp.]